MRLHTCARTHKHTHTDTHRQARSCVKYNVCMHVHTQFVQRVRDASHVTCTPTHECYSWHSQERNLHCECTHRDGMHPRSTLYILCVHFYLKKKKKSKLICTLTQCNLTMICPFVHEASTKQCENERNVQVWTGCT